MIPRLLLLGLILLVPAVTHGADDAPGGSNPSPLMGGVVGGVVPTKILAWKRGAHETRLKKQWRDTTPLEAPDADHFDAVTYPGPLGDMAAWVSPRPVDGTLAPAIVWLTGGFPAGGAGSWLLEKPARSNDQTARAFRDAGVVTLFPCLRGTCGNPGQQEGFYGEVDDVIAAMRYLAGLEGVDPERIYVGGHSTGGTLALLVAESSFEPAGVFAFGPANDPSGYGRGVRPYANTRIERELRQPERYLGDITVPTVIIEGVDGNRWSWERLAESVDRGPFTFVLVGDHDHFSVLAPGTEALAQDILETPSGGRFEVDMPRLERALAEG